MWMRENDSSARLSQSTYDRSYAASAGWSVITILPLPARLQILLALPSPSERTCRTEGPSEIVVLVQSKDVSVQELH
jgi:hypothetical protein